VSNFLRVAFVKSLKFWVPAAVLLAIAEGINWIVYGVLLDWTIALAVFLIGVMFAYTYWKIKSGSMYRSRYSSAMLL
jgi:uncharacterized transporter YbjL